MERRNIQLEHGQPMEQTRGLFCTCENKNTLEAKQPTLVAKLETIIRSIMSVRVGSRIPSR